MAEQFTFQERLGKRRAIDRNQGAGSPFAVIMNRTGHQFFTRPAVPMNQYGDIARGGVLLSL